MSDEKMKAEVLSIDKGKDPFENLDQLRLGQNFTEMLGVKKQLTNVPVRKPGRQDFIMVHPDEGYHFATAILEVKEDRENYIITPNIWAELPQEITPKILYTSMNRQGVLFLWPVKLEDDTGRLDEWNRSAHKAAQEAMKNWVRLASNRSLGAYEIFLPSGELPDPEWPNISFQEILRIAFRDKIIETPDHPVIKRLRGEI